LIPGRRHLRSQREDEKEGARSQESEVGWDLLLCEVARYAARVVPRGDDIEQKIAKKTKNPHGHASPSIPDFGPCGGAFTTKFTEDAKARIR
jgi:hypothetical protein